MLFLAEVGTMDLKVNRIATLGHMHTVRRESEGVCVCGRVERVFVYPRYRRKNLCVRMSGPSGRGTRAISKSTFLHDTTEEEVADTQKVVRGDTMGRRGAF